MKVNRKIDINADVESGTDNPGKEWHEREAQRAASDRDKASGAELRSYLLGKREAHMFSAKMTPYEKYDTDTNPLVRGDKLNASQKREVLSAFGYRWTTQNEGRARNWYAAGKSEPPRAPLVSDEQWLREHAFHFNAKTGRLSLNRKRAEPVYLIDNPHSSEWQDIPEGRVEIGTFTGRSGGEGMLFGGKRVKQCGKMSKRNPDIKKAVRKAAVTTERNFNAALVLGAVVLGAVLWKRGNWE